MLKKRSLLFLATRMGVLERSERVVAAPFQYGIKKLCLKKSLGTVYFLYSKLTYQFWIVLRNKKCAGVENSNPVVILDEF